MSKINPQYNPNMELTSLITKFQLEIEKAILSTIESTAAEHNIDDWVIDSIKRSVNGEIKNKSRMMLQDFRVTGTASSSTKKSKNDPTIELMKAKQKITNLEALLDRKNVPKDTYVKMTPPVSFSKQDATKKKMLQLELQVQKLKIENERKIIDAIKSYSIKLSKLEGELQQKEDFILERDKVINKTKNILLEFDIRSTESKNKIKESKEQFESLKSRMLTLQNKLNESAKPDDGIENLNNLIGEKNIQIQDISNKKDFFQSKMNSLLEDKKSQDNKIVLLTNQNGEMKKNFNEIQVILEAKEQQILSLNSALESNSSIETSGLSITKELTFLEEIDNLKLEKKRLESLIKSDSSKSDINTQEISQKNDIIKDLNKKLNGIKNDLKTTSDNYYSLKKVYDDKIDTLKVKETSLVELNKKVEVLEQEFNNKENDLSWTSNELNTSNKLTDQLKKQNEVFQEEIKKYRDLNRSLKITLTSVQHEKNQLNDENNLIKEEFVKIESQTKELKNEQSKLISRYNSKEIELRSKSKEIEQLYSEIENVRSFSSDENEEFIKEKDKLRKENIKYDQQLQIIKEEMSSQVKINSEKRIEFEDLLKAHETLKLSNKKIEMEKQNNLREIISNKEEIERLTSIVSENEVQSMSNLNSVQDFEREKTSLVSERDQWKIQYQNIKSSYEQLKITTNAQKDEFKNISFEKKELDQYKTAVTIMRTILEGEPYYSILFRLQERRTMSIKELTALTASEPVLIRRTINLLKNEGWVDINEDTVTLKKEFIPI